MLAYWLVDDSATNRRVLGRQLEHSGFLVTTCQSGPECLLLLQAAAASGQPFDVLITDHQMPEMTGMQLAWAIREDARLSATRLLLLSCMGSNVTLSDMAHSGFSAYLSKPVQRRELLNCLTTVLAQPAGKWQMENPRGTTKTSSSRRPDSALYEGHVLVVDDNLVNQKVAQRYLERLGCTVTIAGDGEEAVCRHSTTRFDLILMDLQMPKMDGYEAARRIRTAEPAGVPRTPIVALTADAMTASIDAALAAGMDHFLTKPIEIAPLRDALDRFLRLSNGTPIAARN